MMEVKNNRVLVMGAGKVRLSAARFLREPWRDGYLGSRPS